MTVLFKNQTTSAHPKNVLPCVAWHEIPQSTILTCKYRRLIVQVLSLVCTRSAFKLIGNLVRLPTMKLCSNIRFERKTHRRNYAEKYGWMPYVFRSRYQRAFKRFHELRTTRTITTCSVAKSICILWTFRFFSVTETKWEKKRNNTKTKWKSKIKTIKKRIPSSNPRLSIHRNGSPI